MSYVVGIDPSLVRTGITVLRLTDSGVARPKVLRDCGYSLSDSPSWDESALRIMRQAQKIAAVIDKLDTPPKLVLVESIPPQKYPKPSYCERWALWYGIWSAILARDLPRASVIPGTAKKFATGIGNAEKEHVHAEVSKWWPNVTIANHDIADSAVCAAMAAMKLGWQLPFETRRRHVENLDTVHWPEMNA